MDRRLRSRLVQFWLTVEGLKDPLEAAAPDASLDSSITLLEDDATVKDNQTILEDVSFIYQTYFAQEPSLDIPGKHLAVIKGFADAPPSPMTAAEVRRAKQAMFAAQKATYDQMEEEDWADFRKSELYLKAVTDLGRSGAVPLPQPAISIASVPRTSPSPPPPPVHTQRQQTAPAALAKKSTEPRSPIFRNVPTLINGSFTPATVTTPASSVSTTPPFFERVTESRPRVPSADGRMSMSMPSLPATPGPVTRRSSHLDFLISGENQEEAEERSKLFDDDDESGQVEEEEDYVQVQRMEAIQAALNEIIASDDMVAGKTEHVTRMSPEPEELKSPSTSMILLGTAEKHDAAVARLASRSAEDLKSPSLPRGTSSLPHSRVTSDNQASGSPSIAKRRSTPKLSFVSGRSKLFDDEAAEEDEVGDEGMEGDPIDVVQLAAPGDLQLSVEIARLQDKILGLLKQGKLLDTLIRQAELTGNQTELRILRRGQSSVRREQRTAIFQKAQFEQQEEENRLVPGRTEVTIPSAVVTTEEGEGKQVVRYTIEVKQRGEDGGVRVAWVVARRYNEFWELDRGIREWAVTSGDSSVLDEVKWKVAELPGKKLVPNVSSSFVESRRLGLERYIQVSLKRDRT
jgi:sorting nexin-25